MHKLIIAALYNKQLSPNTSIIRGYTQLAQSKKGGWVVSLLCGDQATGLSTTEIIYIHDEVLCHGTDYFEEYEICRHGRRQIP